MSSLWWRDSNQTASGKPGAVQIVPSATISWLEKNAERLEALGQRGFPTEDELKFWAIVDSEIPLVYAAAFSTMSDAVRDKLKGIINWSIRCLGTWSASESASRERLSAAILVLSITAGSENLWPHLPEVIGANDELIELVLARKLKTVVRLKSLTGLRSIVVDPAQVSAALPNLDTTGISKSKFFEQCGLRASTASHLIKKGILRRTLAQRPGRSSPLKIITHDEIQRFEAEYISLATLAKNLGRTSGPLSQSLAAKGILPIPMPKRLSKIYRVADLDLYEPSILLSTSDR